MIRILVADDHPVVREGLRQIIAATRDMVVVDEAPDGRELVTRARHVPHDLVLLDLSMPGPDGLDVLTQLKRERPRIPVVILTLSAGDQFAVRALKAGAAAYLMKDSASAELVRAIRTAVAGRRYLTDRVAEQIADHLAAVTENPHDALSNREYQVMRMIAAGKSTRRIAAELALSVKTIATYRSRIFQKMHMKTPAELAAYVVRNRLAD